MGYHKYHEDWIREHFDEYQYISDLHRAYCATFDADISFRAMCHWCERRGLKSNRYVPWSDEEIEYLAEIYPVNSVEDTVKEINKQFKTKRTISAVRSLASELKLKQEDWVLGDTLRKKFKAENGTVSVYNGYAYIRLESGWYPYQRYLLEQEFGALPKGYQVIFKDGDKSNFALDNLIGIPTRWMSTMTKFNWRDEFLEVGIMWFILNDLCNGIETKVYRKEI